MGALAGRDVVVADVVAKLVSSQAALLWGTPGVGKSALAAKVAQTIFQLESCTAEGAKLFGSCSADLRGMQALG